MKRFVLLLSLLIFTGNVWVSFGEDVPTDQEEHFALAAPFTSFMVLQREISIPVWGTGIPDSEVTVKLCDQEKTTRVSQDGKWSLKLDPIAAGGPFTVTATSNSKTVELEQVLVGDVWICAGQSNMAFFLKTASTFQEETGPLQNIRILRVIPQGTPEPTSTVKVTDWSVCTPQNAAYFSAVAYYFGKELDKTLNADRQNIPIGLIDLSWGGATCEAFMDARRLETNPELTYLLNPKRIEKLPVPKRAAFIYNGMMTPIIPYAIKGVVWYQGEGNAPDGRASEYATLFPMMIQNWRDAWHQGDFPFYFVQLPILRELQKTPNDQSEWAELRHSQQSGLSLAETEQAVTLDLGDANDIHPRNKKDVGFRLAKIALALDYSVAGEYTGPFPTSLKIEGDMATIGFKHIGTGLVAQGNSLEGFAVAGSDRVFRWCDAKIENDNVVLPIQNLVRPITVRYAWADNPIGNLYNRDGFPAGTFEIRE